MQSIINSEIAEDAKIYQANVINSAVLSKASIGDDSKLIESHISSCCRIDRLNHIDSSIIGDHSYTGKNTMILHSRIGKFCAISWNVTIGGADHDYRYLTNHSFLYNPSDKVINSEKEAVYNRFERPVTIGNDVWIAAGAVITRGVTIGNGAVIGANSVVTRDIPPYAIAVGSPAKVLKYRFDEEIIPLLEKLQWWDWGLDKIIENIDYFRQHPSKEMLTQLLSK